MKHTLVFDLSNLTYIGAGLQVQGVEKHPHAAEVIYTSTVNYLRDLYRQFHPDQVIFACDGNTYWRKEVFPDYKAQRPDNAFKMAVREAIQKFKDKHAHLCLELDGCEADDVIYGLSVYMPGKITVVSTDGDFVQLISDHLAVYSPRQRQYQRRPLDAELALFIKCMRGDISDNIPAAYPRVTERRLASAFQHPDIKEMLLNTRMKCGSLVRDRYEFNRKLIDMREMPEALKLALQAKILSF